LTVLREKESFCKAAAAVSTSKPNPPAASRHEEADKACDTEKEKDNDCAIDQAKPHLFGVVGRDERSIKNLALPAHVVCNPGHAWG